MRHAQAPVGVPPSQNYGPWIDRPIAPIVPMYYMIRLMDCLRATGVRTLWPRDGLTLPKPYPNPNRNLPKINRLFPDPYYTSPPNIMKIWP